MHYEERRPSHDLSMAVKQFWTLEHDGFETPPEVVLPDGCPEIVFNLSDRFRRFDVGSDHLQPQTLFAGQMSRRILIAPTGRVRLFGVRLTPTGAFAVSGIPQAEFVDRTPSIDSIFGRLGMELEDAVNSADTFSRRCMIVEAYARRQLAGCVKNVFIARAATDLMSRYAGTVSVPKIAAYLNRSERSLERDFREYVGITPKLFARIQRFQNVVRTIGSGSDASMIDAALSAGFFDQSHMIRDFKEFAGATPKEYLSKTHALSALFTAAA